MHDEDLHRLAQSSVHTATPVEAWEVSEQLLLAGLRDHALTIELERQLAFTKAIAGSLSEGVCTIDRTGRITFVNAAAEHLLGWQEAEVIGRAASSVLQSPGAVSNSDPFQMLDVRLASATTNNAHAVFLRKDGTTFPVAFSMAPLIVDTQIVGVVIAFNDLTEVQRLHQMQEEYLALLTHDLRSPLTAMIGYAQLLLRQLEAAALERAMRSAEAIVKSGTTMDRLIQDVLDRSRLQIGRAELQLASVNLVQLVSHCIDENLLPADRARVELETVTILIAVVDPIQMQRVIVNLLTNACKYSSSSAPVVVHVFIAGRDAVISITDQGIGIDADDLSHLFEKHFRAGTTGMVEGTGLGLYGSRLIVEAHGGRIWATSTLGMGSIFQVAIPMSSPLS